MDRDDARALAEELLASEPPDSDPVLLKQTDDHDWCWVIQWTTRAALDSGRPPQPGFGPIAVDKTDREAFYLSSQPLLVALQLARQMRGK